MLSEWHMSSSYVGQAVHRRGRVRSEGEHRSDRLGELLVWLHGVLLRW